MMAIIAIGCSFFLVGFLSKALRPNKNPTTGNKRGTEIIKENKPSNSAIMLEVILIQKNKLRCISRPIYQKREIWIA